MHSLRNLKKSLLFREKLALSPLLHTEIGTGIIDLFCSLLSGVFLSGCPNILKAGARAGRLNSFGSVSRQTKSKEFNDWEEKEIERKKRRKIGRLRRQQISSLCVWEKKKRLLLRKWKAKKNWLGALSVESPLLSNCPRLRYSTQKQRIHAHQSINPCPSKAEKWSEQEEK